MNTKNIKPVAVAVGIALAASMGTTAVSAENPFMATSLSAGYMSNVYLGADAEKAAETKKAEGKCGGDKAEGADKKAEGSCGGDKGAEGSCGGDKAEGADKGAEGSCGGDKAEDAKEKGAEGKCGEGKCGGNV